MADVHELINLRGYGEAEKVLRKKGLWNDPKEKIEKLIDKVSYFLDSIVDEANDAESALVDLHKALEATE